MNNDQNTICGIVHFVLNFYFLSAAGKFGNDKTFEFFKRLCENGKILSRTNNNHNEYDGNISPHTQGEKRDIRTDNSNNNSKERKLIEWKTFFRFFLVRE